MYKRLVVYVVLYYKVWCCFYSIGTAGYHCEPSTVGRENISMITKTFEHGHHHKHHVRLVIPRVVLLVHFFILIFSLSLTQSCPHGS